MEFSLNFFRYFPKKDINDIEQWYGCKLLRLGRGLKGEPRVMAGYTRGRSAQWHPATVAKTVREIDVSTLPIFCPHTKQNQEQKQATNNKNEISIIPASNN